jgi:hypothetical protein
MRTDKKNNKKTENWEEFSIDLLEERLELTTVSEIEWSVKWSF